MFNSACASFVWLSLTFLLCNFEHPYARPIPSTDQSVPQAQVTLPPLPYDYSALEPAISKEIMTLHHQKHHAAYVKALNTATQAYAVAVAANDLSKQIELQPAIKFNGGGHINHSAFWKILQPVASGGGKLKDGAFAHAVTQQFGDLEKLKQKINAAGASLQGSGWVWLAYNKDDARMEIMTTPNQDTLTGPHVPIINIDIWEHAYYLQYNNRKADYLNNIWTVINFDEAEARFKATTA